MSEVSTVMALEQQRLGSRFCSAAITRPDSMAVNSGRPGLVVDNVPPHRVSEGDVIVVTEGRRVVAYFHVESMDPIV